MVKADCSVHVIVDKTLTALTQKNQKNHSFCGTQQNRTKGFNGQLLILWNL